MLLGLETLKTVNIVQVFLMNGNTPEGSLWQENNRSHHHFLGAIGLSSDAYKDISTFVMKYRFPCPIQPYRGKGELVNRQETYKA